MKLTLFNIVSILMTASVLVCLGFIAGYAVGGEQGYDLGDKLCSAGIENVLMENSQGRTSFYVGGMRIRFFPRGDSTGKQPRVGYQVASYQIAGAGADTREVTR